MAISKIFVQFQRFNVPYPPYPRTPGDDLDLSKLVGFATPSGGLPVGR